MRVCVAGVGIQGRKRIKAAGDDVGATVDPVVEGATHRALEDVPLSSFDAALLCIPDAEKPAALEYLVEGGKHVLVEKPIAAAGALDLTRLQAEADRRGVVVYTAYNHRFEPHLARLAALLREGAIGDPYRVSMLYGNGTARDVRSSPWRDTGLGVVTDLLPHLLDTLLFITGKPDGQAEIWSATRHENAAFDHFLIGFPDAAPVATLEGTLLSWRNTFRLDLLGSEGSMHMDGLCKWGPNTLSLRRRMLPSGKPPEQVWRLEQPDPTWELEYAHFQELCAEPATDLSRDIWIDWVLQEIASGCAVSA